MFGTDFGKNVLASQNTVSSTALYMTQIKAALVECLISMSTLKACFDP